MNGLKRRWSGTRDLLMVNAWSRLDAFGFQCKLSRRSSSKFWVPAMRNFYMLMTSPRQGQDLMLLNSSSAQNIRIVLIIWLVHGWGRSYLKSR